LLYEFSLNSTHMSEIKLILTLLNPRVTASYYLYNKKYLKVVYRQVKFIKKNINNYYLSLYMLFLNILYSISNKIHNKTKSIIGL